GRALRMYPQYIEALTDIGTIFLLYNRPESALMFLHRADDADNCNQLVKLNMAIALTEQNDYVNALKLLKEILRAEPRMALAQYLIAKIDYLQKKFDAAETYARQALDNNPKLLDGWVLLINISIEQNKYDQARDGLERIRDAMKNQMVTRFIDEQ